MATKAIERDDLNSCFNKAADNEPLFILRAQDRLAPQAVRVWAALLASESGSSQKVAEASALAEAMEKWPTRKLPD